MAPGVLLALLALGAPAGCRSETMPLEVPRHEAEVDVHPDGSLVVTETFEVSVLAANGTFERLVESPRADALRFVGASIDGRAIPTGPAPPDAPAVEVEEGDELLVRWHLPDEDAQDVTPRGPHRLELQYRVDAATEVLRDRGRVVWPVLPVERTFAVGQSRITLTLPGTSQWLRGTGMAEAGWTVEATPRGISAGHPDVGLASATLLAEFTIDRRAVVLPEWQVTAELRSEFALAFVTGAAFVVVIGVGVLWLVGFQYRQHSPVDPERLAVAQGFATTARVGALFAIACGLVAQLTLSRFGWWAQVIPLSLLAMAGAFFVAGRRFQARTDKGSAPGSDAGQDPTDRTC
jgi:hypothetical protein